MSIFAHWHPCAQCVLLFYSEKLSLAVSRQLVFAEEWHLRCSRDTESAKDAGNIDYWLHVRHRPDAGLPHLVPVVVPVARPYFGGNGRPTNALDLPDVPALLPPEQSIREAHRNQAGQQRPALPAALFGGVAADCWARFWQVFQE